MGLECGLEHRMASVHGVGDSVPYDFPANAHISNNNV